MSKVSINIPVYGPDGRIVSYKPGYEDEGARVLTSYDRSSLGVPQSKTEGHWFDLNDPLDQGIGRRGKESE